MSKFLSGRQSNLNIGIGSYTEDKKVLEVIGNVGIGSTAFEPSEKLDVRGSVNVSDTITATEINVDIINADTVIATGLGNSFRDLTVFGLSTFGSDVYINGYVDISNNLNVSGFSTFVGDVVFNSDIDVDGHTELDDLNVSGLSTFASDVDIQGELHGPAEFIIDPAAVGDNTGLVRIKGDLYVDGTEFIVNSTTIELADFKVGIATTVGTNLLLDGAGIGIGSGGIEKTFTYNNSANTLESSIGLGVTSGAEFKTGTDTVLNRTTLGPTVVNSSLTSVGTLGNLNVSGVTTSTGGFVGDLTGVASTATALETARDFSISGDATASPISFDGTDNVGLALTLATVNGDVGTFGSQTEIPVVTVNAKGLVTAVSTALVGTALTVAGDSGSEVIDLLTETLTISGGTNLTSSAASDTITIDLDDNISLNNIDASGIVTATGGFVGNLTGTASTASFATTAFTLNGRVESEFNVATATTATNVIGGIGSLSSLSVSGLSTFVGIVTSQDNLFVGNDLNVAGDTRIVGVLTVGSSSITIDGDTNTINVGSGVTIHTTRTTLNQLETIGVSTFKSDVDIDGDTRIVGVLTVGSSSITIDGDTNTINVGSGVTIHTTRTTLNQLETIGVSTFKSDVDIDASLDVDGHTELDTLNVSIAATIANLTLANTGIAVTAILDEDTFISDRDDALATQQSIKAYVDSRVTAQDLDFAGDTGSGAVDLDSEIFSIVGTENEIETVGSGNTLTIGLPGSVAITTSLTIGSATTITGSGIVAGIITGTLDNTLTLNTSGTGISGSATYDNSSATIFTVTSNATDTNTSGTIVARDGSGNFSAGTITADLTGTATTATQLETPRTFEITGDVVASPISFDGTGNVSLAATIQPNSVELGTDTFGDYVATIADSGDSDVIVNNSGTETAAITLGLTTTGITAGSYGSSTEIPTFTVDSRGRLTAAGSAAVGAALTVNGDSGSEVINFLSETLTISGGTNLTSSAISDTVTLNLDDNISLTNIDASGIITASSFVGTLTGDVTGVTGGVASTATRLETPRTFEITGDVVASPISFDGTGNVSLAATIQPNSVGLGTDTFGNYVETISGTVGQITVTGGTGEGSTPTVSIASNATLPGNVTIANDLQVNNNLNVTGNITIGGTTGYILVENFRVSDPDIILGFTTDGSGNDASNDTTANHGGIAVASTEGNPLVDLTVAGIETLPTTYKKIMWFKAGSFAGLGTDAWLSNYAVGIGSTQFPTGTRLAAGSVQITENDLAVVRNIDASGIITASSFVGNVTGDVTGVTGGVASTATQLETPRTFEITGDVVASPISFDGTGNVSLAATIQPNSVELGTDTFGDYVATIADSGDSDVIVNNSGTETAAVTLGLTTTGITAGSYGSSTEIPTFTVDSRGRLTAAGSASVGAALTVNGDSGSEVINFLSETLTISGGTNLTSSAASDTITINLDDNISLTNVNATGIITASSFVGNVTGDVTGVTGGVASTATRLETPRTFQITGDVVASPISFDGTGNVSLAATIQPNSVGLGTDTFGNYVATIDDSGDTDIIVNNSGTETAAITLGLTTTGITAGSYGSSTEIPTFTVDSRGRLTAAGTASVGAALTVAGDTGSEVINFLSETLTISGGTNLTSSAASDTITINLDDNISLTNVNATGIVTATGGFVGNLTGTASTASFATTAFNLNGVVESDLNVAYADNAGITTNINGGDAGDIPYQSAANTTTFVDATTASTGQVLLWNGSVPTWANVSATSGFFGGMSVRDEGVIVGTAGSIATIDFVGSNIEATASSGANGISTVTFSDSPTFNSVTVTGLTSTQNLNVSGVSTFQGNVHLGDNDKALFGTGDDLEIYHDGTFTNSYIDNNSGSLFIRGASGSHIRIQALSGEQSIVAAANGSVDLYYDNLLRFETTYAGATLTGTLTASEYRTGTIGSAIGINTNTISGPATLTIDPAAVGDDTGLVVIKGDLQVDGTQTIINSTTVTVNDKNIQVADGAINDAAADGAGITVNSGDGDKTFQFVDANDSFQTNISLDVTSGNVYKINGQEVLSADTLGSGVVNSSLTSVGTLGNLNVSGATTTNTLNATGNAVFDANIGIGTTNPTAKLDVNGNVAIGGQISVGGTTGTDGQYLQSTGVGVSWASFPTLRTTQTNVATNGQTAFNFSYNINFLDVFVNGIKLTSTEYTATNGSQIVLASPAFGGDIVEFHSYNTISVGGGSGGSGASIMSDLGDVTFSTLSNGQLLQYESITGQWKNITPTYATEAYVGLATTGLASEAYVGLATAGLASEAYVGTVPQNAQTSAYVLVASDSGKHISITTGGVTVPQNVFSIGDTVAIYNNSSSSQTITQGTGVTLRFTGTSSTGNRTLDQYGLCSILCVGSNTFAISGTGLS